MSGCSHSWALWLDTCWQKNHLVQYLCQICWNQTKERKWPESVWERELRTYPLIPQPLSFTEQNFHQNCHDAGTEMYNTATRPPTTHPIPSSSQPLPGIYCKCTCVLCYTTKGPPDSLPVQLVLYCMWLCIIVWFTYNMNNWWWDKYIWYHYGAAMTSTLLP